MAKYAKARIPQSTLTVKDDVGHYSLWMKHAKAILSQ